MSHTYFVNLFPIKFLFIKHNDCCSLKELILDRNGIKDLPNEVTRLKNLRNISIVGNLLSAAPCFFNMRALALTVC